MSDDTALIDRLVQNIRKAGAVARAPIEQAAGVHLRVTSESDYYRSFTAPPISAGELRYTIELREPKAGSGATSGALLVMDVAGGCTHKAALETRYGDWQLTDVPRGRSPDEKAYWSKVEAWGELSFGFTDSAPDCLRTVVFQANRQ